MHKPLHYSYTSAVKYLKKLCGLDHPNAIEWYGNDIFDQIRKQRWIYFDILKKVRENLKGEKI